jgi:hypothetical protein
VPAYSKEFPWPSYYGNFKFFEDKIRAHSNVISLERCGTGVYVLERESGKGLKVFICECYAFGIAEYMEAVENLGPLDAIIINSLWCGYSKDAKLHSRQHKVGLFKIGDFMAALNRDDFWNHLNESEREHYEEG